MTTIHQALDFFNNLLPTCTTDAHMVCIHKLEDNIIKQYKLEPNCMEVYCMKQTIRLHQQYLQHKNTQDKQQFLKSKAALKPTKK